MPKMLSLMVEGVSGCDRPLESMTLGKRERFCVEVVQEMAKQKRTHNFVSRYAKDGIKPKE